jgi:hypothetical protein
MTDKKEKIEFPLDILDHNIQSYERSAKRYGHMPFGSKELMAQIQPRTVPVDSEKFVEYYSNIQGYLNKINIQLFAIDTLAEHRFRDHLDTPDFERMRRALDKCAERLHWTLNRHREMGYFLRKMLQNFVQNLEEPPKEKDL